MQEPHLPSPIFIVILDLVLVARDIEMIIADAYPDARIIVARTAEEAEAEVPAGRVSAAFVQETAPRFLDSALGQRVARDGGQVVTVGCEPLVKRDAPCALAFPFAHTDVQKLLMGLTLA